MTEYVEKNIKFCREASDAGLRIVGKGPNSSYRQYEFTSCNHKQHISVNMVRRGNFKCRRCFILEIKSVAKACGLELLSEKNRKKRYLFKIKKCEHVIALPLKTVRSGSFSCRKCYTARLRQLGSSVGFDYIGQHPKMGYRSFVCRSCKSEKAIAVSQLARGTVKCDPCYQHILKSEANTVGLKYLGPSNSGDVRKRRYEFEKCGHQQKIETSRVRIGSFKCQTCFDESFEHLLAYHDLELIDRLCGGWGEYKALSCGHTQKLRRDYILNGHVKCSVCALDKKAELMNAAGVEFLEPLSSGLGVYKISKCGHTKTLSMQQIHMKNFECNDCDEEIFKAEASANDLKIVGAAAQRGYRLYEFINCGHQQVASLSHVRRGNIRCNECLREKRDEIAINFGLKIISDGEEQGYLRVIFTECNHEQEIQVSNFYRGQFRCQKCIVKKLEMEALDGGLVIIGDGRNRSYRMYEFIECGHQKEIQVSDVRRKSFSCNSCEETSWTQPSTLYLLEITVGNAKWLKLGYAKNVDARIERYGLPNNANVAKLKVKDCSTGQVANKLERFIHRKFDAYHINSAIMAKYHQKSGNTECFPLDMKLKLLELMDTRVPDLIE